MGLIEQIINNKITDKNAIWLMRQAEDICTRIQRN